MRINPIQSYNNNQSFGHVVLGRQLTELYKNPSEAKEFVKTFKELQKTKLNLPEILKNFAEPTVMEIKRYKEWFPKVTLDEVKQYRQKALDEFLEAMSPKEKEDYTVKVNPDIFYYSLEHYNASPEGTRYYGTAIDTDSGKAGILKQNCDLGQDMCSFSSMTGPYLSNFTQIKYGNGNCICLPTPEYLKRRVEYELGRYIRTIADKNISMENMRRESQLEQSEAFSILQSELEK